jgi:hypothetical protein
MYGILKIQKDATVEAAKACANGKGGAPVKVVAPKQEQAKSAGGGGTHNLPDV